MDSRRPRSTAMALLGVCLLAGTLLLAGCGSDAGAPTAAPGTVVDTAGLSGPGPDRTGATDGESGAVPDTRPGTTAPDPASDPTAVPGSGVPDTTAAPDSGSAPVTDRPSAPDFRLELGDGSEFSLSEESRPVFLVFWAEW